MNSPQGAPGWARTQLFDIRAKVDAGSVGKLKELTKAATMMVEVRQIVSRTPTLRMVMLQRLLEERFHLKVHYTQVVLPFYAMTVAKSGVRMAAAHPVNAEHGSMSRSAGKLDGDNVPMAFLPEMFALELERPVLDKTATEGNFDFHLRWARMGDAEEAGADASAPSFFTAVQEQMGLKLKPGKGPVWVLVVDHAELPSEN